MQRPRLEIDATGNRYLTVYYHPDDRDYTRVIQDGFRFHKIDDTEAVKIPVVVLPMARKSNAKRCFQRERF